MKQKHFDAKGRECYGWLDLKEIITNKESLDLLKRFMLFRLNVYPFIEIRIFPSHPESAEIRLYGCGNDQVRSIELNPPQLDRLRKFYLQAGKRGWKVEKTERFIAFRRDARVTHAS